MLLPFHDALELVLYEPVHAFLEGYFVGGVTGLTVGVEIGVANVFHVVESEV